MFNRLNLWNPDRKRQISLKHDANLGIIRQIEGDFVAAVVTLEQVVLLRSLTSTTMLFYRVNQNTIMWSTSFMDLVDAPFDDMDGDALAYVAWGGNAIPYSGIETLLPGEFVRFNAQGIVRGRFDEYKHGGVRRMSLAEWASLRGNLSCGPLLRGHSIFARLDCSLKELSKFIRKYLGKMLNAFGTILGLLLLPLSGGETRYNVG